MSGPGPVRNLVVSGGNLSLIVTFNKPATGTGPFRYYYNVLEFAADPVDWNAIPTDADSIIFNLSKDIEANIQYTVEVTAQDIFGNFSTGVQGNATPVGPIDTFTYLESDGNVGYIFTDAVTNYVEAGQADSVVFNDATNLPADTLNVALSYSTEENALITVGALDGNDTANDELKFNIDEEVNRLGGIKGPTFSFVGSSVDSNGDNKELDTDVLVEIEQTFSDLPPKLDEASKTGGTITANILKLNTNGWTSEARTVADFSATILKLLAKLQKKKSIYLIVYTTSSGTTVTVPVENNQAYNDYLHDESGYQNRRENRLLTSGFYRGPVDSSTLTRIRSANGVLLGVNGVPGGMQGSRCCP